MIGIGRPVRVQGVKVAKHRDHDTLERERVVIELLDR